MKEHAARIVLVAGGIELGGATTFLLNLAGEFVRRKISVLVVSLEHKNPYRADFAERGIPLHLEDERRNIFEDRISSALAAIRAFAPTSVIACLGPSSFEMLRYVPKQVTKLGMIQSDFPENYPPFLPYVDFLDGMVAVSRQIEAALGAISEFRRLPLHYLPYGVEIPRAPSQRRPRRPASGEPIRILYLGRLSEPQKRVRLFPEFLQHLQSARIPFEWTIAGDGPERDWLHEHLGSGCGSVRVQFAGGVKYSEVPAILRDHDIFLLASDAEGLPLSLLEAMAYGLVPVVSELQSGISEVVNPNCGITIPPSKVERYAAAIISLARDPERLAAMGDAAADVARADFSVEAMTDRWVAVLSQYGLTCETDEWPRNFHVRAPLSDSRRWRFTGPMRLLRRFCLEGSAAARPRSSPR